MSDVEDDIDEAFRISIEKNGDNTRVETQGDEAQELMDFAKAILGDNFDVFDQDFADAVEITDTEVEPAEFDYEINATKEIDGKDVDPFEDDLFSEDEEDGSEEPVESSEESAKDSDDEESEDDDYVPDESKELVAEIEKTSADETPKDMIDGKLVDAKDPTESEVEVAEDEDLEECTTAEFVNEDARELKGDLKLAAEADADYREAELRRGEEQAEAEQEAREEAAEETPAEVADRIEAVLDAWDFDDNDWPEPEDLDSLPKEGEEIPFPSEDEAPPAEDDEEYIDMSDEEFAQAFGEALAEKKLAEHVNEENDPIESDQELQGTDNAVNACKVNKVITHADDEKPLNELFDLKADVNADLHNFGGQGNNVSVLSPLGGLGEELEDEESKELEELFDADIGINLDAHDFGGTNNDVDVLS